MKPLCVVLLFSFLASCTKPDRWAEAPPVCPTICTVWHVGFESKSKTPGTRATICITDPKGHDGPGRLIAVDPNNPHIVAVAFDDGCW